MPLQHKRNSATYTVPLFGFASHSNDHLLGVHDMTKLLLTLCFGKHDQSLRVTISMSLISLTQKMLLIPAASLAALAERFRN